MKRAHLGIAAISLALATTACDREAAQLHDPQIDEASTAAFSHDSVLADAAIAGAVERQLQRDAAIDTGELEVQSQRGIIHLVGTVDNLLAKERAGRIAGLVKGVRAVSNRLDVAVSTRPDDAIEDDIIVALTMDPVTEGFEIDVTVRDQEVVLTGTVQSQPEKAIAGRLAARVVGVRAVDNQLRIDFGAPRDDAEIIADVSERLRWDSLIDTAALDVDVEDGQVTLSGSVPTLAQKNRAWAAAWVNGVRGVDAEGLVASWKAGSAALRDDVLALSDDAIEDAVGDALLYDPRIHAFGLKVSVEQRVVTLAGDVSTLRAKRIAEAIAAGTVGVAAVVNDIHVEPLAPIGKALLHTRLLEALARNPITEAHEIDVAIRGGVVTLTGSVDSTAEQIEAEEVVSGLVGVEAVDNQLQVTKPAAFAYSPYMVPYHPYARTWKLRGDATGDRDAELADDIRDELYWSPFVDVNDVRVSVENGTATLSGVVDSQNELKAAVRNAHEAGVDAVIVELDVRS